MLLAVAAVPCFRRPGTIKVCHILLQNPKFFQLPLQIDIDPAAQTPLGNARNRGLSAIVPAALRI